jgi:hypothetical protein
MKRIIAQQGSVRASEQFCFGTAKGFDQKMVMIAHQGIGMNSVTSFLSTLRQGIKKTLPNLDRFGSDTQEVKPLPETTPSRNRWISPRNGWISRLA